jgi:CheY-like chemotaxis protein
MKKQAPIESVVFVIDDDASVRASLKSLFESVGLQVQLFGSADAFMQSERPDIPCCLVLDVRLPGLSGLSSNRLATRPVPIIFMTRLAIPMTCRPRGGIGHSTAHRIRLLDAVFWRSRHRARKEEKHRRLRTICFR